MHRYIAATLVLATVIQLPKSANAAPPENADVLGIWTLTRILDSAEITSMSDREAARLVGKTLIVQPDNVVIVGETCGGSDFERHREPAARYVRENYHAPVGRLGLRDTITVVNLGCTEALLKGKNKMVVFWNGFFYDAEKRSGTPVQQARR
jgi:hypothetical protein